MNSDTAYSLPSVYTYPDSVSRVRPPKMTMPKTLAALPNNQYATVLLDVAGKLLANEAVVFFLLEMFFPRFANGDEDEDDVMVLCERKA